MKYLLCIILLLFLSYSVVGQNNCERNLNDARTDYANGNLYAIPGKLTDCLQEGFNESEKIAAYQLLALTYININQQDKAKESLIKLLKIKTDYQAVKNVDPDELYSLYNKIETDPIYYLGILTGTNYTLPIVTHRRTKNSVLGDDEYTYTPAVSFKAGLQFIYPIKKQIYAYTSLAYDVQKYNYLQIVGQSTNTENITTTSYSSTSNGIDFRLGGRFMKDYYKWKPFIEAGIINRFHIKSTINEYFERNDQKPQPFEEDYTIEFRRFYNLGLDLQVGTLRKFQENYWEFAFGASYFVIPETDYSESNPYKNTVANAGHVVEDIYTKLVLSFSIKFNIPFYDFK